MKLVDRNGPDDRMEVQWNFSNSDSALDMNALVLDVKVGAVGKCSMTATVKRWGVQGTSGELPAGT